MEDKDLGCLYVSLNPKAIAILSAIDAELVPETEEGFDDTQFQAFWVSFERRLSEHGIWHRPYALYPLHSGAA